MVIFFLLLLALAPYVMAGCIVYWFRTQIAAVLSVITALVMVARDHEQTITKMKQSP